MQNPMFEEGGWCDRWSPTFLSVLRIMTALLFLSHGTSKILGVPLSTASFPPPWTQFWVAGMLELIGGTLLLIGLFTRPTAFILAGEMAVAYWLVHAPDNFWPALNRGETAILFCFIFLYTVFAGPGPWSVDAWLRRRRAEEGPDSYYEGLRRGGTHHGARVAE
ncbi:DoxX family protein [uncultured Sphingomonas sp.]|uniref:DoxX family protein n=1 Tax=uncultured Sphingomonas sp. TaxID=158754 RepID=UPI0025DA9C41|nr:DoxX family protein [uncultured Sphingomonas sp.]